MYTVTVDGNRLSREFPSWDHLHEFAISHGTQVVVGHYGNEIGAAACYENGVLKWSIGDGWLDF